MMLRRSLFKALGVVPLAAAQSRLSPAQERQRRYDILIKNGEVIDPGRKLRQKADVGVADGKIAAVEPDIPAESGLDVINRVPGMGTLEIGAPADIALLAIEDGNFQLIDSQKNVVNAAERIVSRLTVCRGRRVTTPL